MLVVASGWVVWHLVRHGRRDRVEAALAAGLFAVVVHNFFDFGLETLGVLLPFMAILGTALGRTVKDDRSPKRMLRWPLVATCCAVASSWASPRSRTRASRFFFFFFWGA